MPSKNKWLFFFLTSIYNIVSNEVIHWSCLFHRVPRVMLFSWNSFSVRTVFTPEQPWSVPGQICPRATPPGHSALYSNLQGSNTTFWAPFLECHKSTAWKITCQTLRCARSLHTHRQGSSKTAHQEGSQPVTHPGLFRGDRRVSLFTRRDNMGEVQPPGLSEDCMTIFSRVN